MSARPEAGSASAASQSKEMSTSAAFWSSAERPWSAMREVPEDQSGQSSYWPGARHESSPLRLPTRRLASSGRFSPEKKSVERHSRRPPDREFAASAAPKGKAKEVMDRQSDRLPRQTRCEGMRIEREIQMGASGGGQSIKASGIAARTGRKHQFAAVS